MRLDSDVLAKRYVWMRESVFERERERARAPHELY